MKKITQNEIMLMWFECKIDYLKKSKAEFKKQMKKLKITEFEDFSSYEFRVIRIQSNIEKLDKQMLEIRIDLGACDKIKADDKLRLYMMYNTEKEEREEEEKKKELDEVFKNG